MVDNTKGTGSGEGTTPAPDLLWADDGPTSPPPGPPPVQPGPPPVQPGPPPVQPGPPPVPLGSNGARPGPAPLPWDADPGGNPVLSPPLGGPSIVAQGPTAGPANPLEAPPSPAHLADEANPDPDPAPTPPVPVGATRTFHPLPPAMPPLQAPPADAVMQVGGNARPQPLSEETVLRPRVDRPMEGWRAWLYRVTGGAINLGPSRAEVAWQALVDRCRQPCPDGRRIAVISRKGGVGKTTTTLMIGHTLAAVRPDRVIAIDGNPDAGTLGHRVTRQTDATVVDALGRVGSIVGYPDARGLTSQAPSRLEVLASPEDPHASRALRGADYRSVMDELDKHYNVMLCDTGTGIMDDANLGILDAVDQIVLVTGTALDSARAAAMTLDWLETQGRGHLVRDAVVVVNAISDMGRVDIDQVTRHFEQRCRSVHRIPHDRHLEAGAVTDADMLAPRTQEAWLHVSAAVVEGFGLQSPRAARSGEGTR